MKQYIILGVALILIILLNIWQIEYLKQTSRYVLTDINEIELSLKREDFDGVEKGINELEATWNIIKFGWDIFGEHDDIEQIDEHIQSMRVYTSYKDKEELANEYTLLRSVITHVIDTERFSFKNVL